MSLKTKRIAAILALILIMLSGVVAYYLYSLYKGLEGLNKTDSQKSLFAAVNTSDTEYVEPPKWEGTETVNILFMGVDARGVKKGEIPRSDTMMVASLDPVRKRIHLFSILRDTYTDIPDHGKNRINTAITHGPNTAMKAVSDLLGIPVQYYVYTDFSGFIKLVDEIGGVEFYVEKDMNYESAADQHEYDIHLTEGKQHLDGKTALQYVRFRHDALSDYSRTKRQRDFADAVAQKMKSTTSIMKLPSILEKVSPYMDTNLTVNDMWKLASVGYQSKLEGSEQIPPMKLIKEAYMGKAAVLDVSSRKKLKDFVRNIMESVPTEAPNSLETGESGVSAGRNK